MKKILLSASLVALAVIATSCNSDSKPWYAVRGSVEGYITPTLVGPDGTQYPVLGGSQYMKRIPDGLNRSRTEFGFHTVDETRPGTDSKVNAELTYMELLPTFVPVDLGEASKDDPILVPYYASSGASVTDLKPEIFATMNYLDMLVAHVAYRKNASSGNDFAAVSAKLEIDPEIYPATNGTDCDTIRMVFKFDNNRDASEKVTDAFGPYSSWYSFDLEEMPHYFPTTDDNGDDIMYVIKMEYTSYEDILNLDDDKIVTRTVTTKWVPNDPYWKEGYPQQ